MKESIILFLACICSHVYGKQIYKNNLHLNWEKFSSRVNHISAFETKYFDQKVDHFSFATNRTYKQRYLIDDQYWNVDGGPIFYFVGCEGPIVSSAGHSGFMSDIAPEYGAMLVFAEHRYYGESQPFGEDSLGPDPSKTGYLTSEQSLADHAQLITFLKGTLEGAADSPVIAFGGSYCGMLAAWIRVKYPHLVDGSIASSAPILQMDTPCDAVAKIITQDFTWSSPECANTIKTSWAAIDDVASQGDGKSWLSDQFQTCTPIETESDVMAFRDAMYEFYWGTAQYDYPPYQVNATCKAITEGTESTNNYSRDILRQIAKGVKVTTPGCFQIIFPDDPASNPSLGWEYQSCTEMVMPFCSKGGDEDMFYPSPWNLTKVSEDCYNRWRATPRPRMADIMYGADDLKAASNIILSNGDLDPYSSGGILEDVNESVIAVKIPGGAHCSDLRGTTISNFPGVVQAHKIEKEHITKWIDEARRGHTKFHNLKKHPKNIRLARKH